ncbi:hypothetical protein HRbin39_00020 [bacterium HR39]|nr:hypothetical protein HRbin39_00020 [bacterium HR39]
MSAEGEVGRGGPEPQTGASSGPVEERRPDGAAAPAPGAGGSATAPADKVPEIGGPKGPEPTRYGDWERGGRCIDF